MYGKAYQVSAVGGQRRAAVVGVAEWRLVHTG
jgi:hypothetical protein